jgi:hypothetical protein
MTLREILADIHALEEELLAFERKYGIRSETLALLKKASYHGGHGGPRRKK